MSIDLYVGNLSVKVVKSTLEKLAARVGTVKSVTIHEAQAALSNKVIEKLGVQPVDQVAVIRMVSKVEALAAERFLHDRRVFGRRLVAMTHGGTRPRPPK